MYQMKRQLHTEACLHGDRGGWQTLHNNTIIKAYNGSLNLSAAELKINNWAKGENKKHSCHSLWGIAQVLFFNHLCLRALCTHTGGSQFDHLSQLGDGLGRGVGSLGQFLLARCGSSNQQLGVLHQRFGCLQDALPGGRGGTRHYWKDSTPVGVNHDRFHLFKYGYWSAQFPSASHWKWEAWLLRHHCGRSAPWHQLICGCQLVLPPLLHLWSAKESSFSGFSVPAEANMMVVSRSAMMPETALPAVIQAWVPLFPACSADSTRDTCNG